MDRSLLGTGCRSFFFFFEFPGMTRICKHICTYTFSFFPWSVPPWSTCLLGPLSRVVHCGPSPSQEYGFTLFSVLLGVSSRFQLRLYFVAVAKFQPTRLYYSTEIIFLAVAKFQPTRLYY